MHERNVTVVESGNGLFGQFITTAHHVLGADEPSSLGGKDTGPDPYELVLAGLGACTAMTIRMYAQRKQVRLRHVREQAMEKPKTASRGPSRSWEISRPSNVSTCLRSRNAVP